MRRVQTQFRGFERVPVFVELLAVVLVLVSEVKSLDNAKSTDSL